MSPIIHQQQATLKRKQGPTLLPNGCRPLQTCLFLSVPNIRVNVTLEGGALTIHGSVAKFLGKEHYVLNELTDNTGKLKTNRKSHGLSPCGRDPS